MNPILFRLARLIFKPALNYIGRSQYPDPLFNGSIDDFSIYNYALSPGEVAQIIGAASNIEGISMEGNNRLTIWPVPACDVLRVSYRPMFPGLIATLLVSELNGRQLLTKEIESFAETELKVSNLPSGIYLLKISNYAENLMTRLIIRH